MNLKKLFRSNIPIIWIETHEYERARREVEKIASEEGKDIRTWTITKGIMGKNIQPEEERYIKPEEEPYDTPEIPLNYITNPEINSTTLIVMDFHRFLDSAEILRKMLDVYEEARKNFNQMIIISPVANIPTEIEKYITLIELPLPDQETLKETLEKIVSDHEGLLDEEWEKQFWTNPQTAKEICRAASGLTLNEFENAITLSIASKNKIDIRDIFEQKKQMILKTAGLQIFDPKEIDEVKGLDRAKEYITKAIRSGIGKGSLLVGIPGTGKSLLAKQVGRITGLPTIILDLGMIFGSLVGESERRISHALKTIEAMAPCILFIDELEKGISGINSSAMTDGGTGSRVFGKFLTWLNDKNSGVYVIATANNLSLIPPEFLRSGRWDWIFFVDTPDEETAQEILKYYCQKYSVDYKPTDLKNYTGAEIKAIVENAKILGCNIEEAKKSVITIAKSKKEEIETMRKEAKEKYLPATYPHKTKKQSRKIKI